MEWDARHDNEFVVIFNPHTGQWKCLSVGCSVELMSDGELKVSKGDSQSQHEIRRMVYSHHGTGVSFISQPPREGFEALVPHAPNCFHTNAQARKCFHLPNGKKLQLSLSPFFSFFPSGRSLTASPSPESRTAQT